MKNNETYLCGKHKITFDNPHQYHLHIIDDHDSEHGKWQPVGYQGWTSTNLKTGITTKFYGDFRYLPMYHEKECWMGNHRLKRKSD